VTNESKQLAAEDVDRCYHGTAVLPPDARVLSAGGGELIAGSQPNDPRDSHHNGQIFYPPQLPLRRAPQPRSIFAIKACRISTAGPNSSPAGQTPVMTFAAWR
jgi:hypothetical protein